MNAKERGELISLREYVDLRFNSLNDFLKEHWRAVDEERETFKKYMEKRLSDLNGEAWRLKTVLDHSVPKEVFENYVSTQRDKSEASERAQRDHFDTYVEAQRKQFNAYVEAQELKQAEYQRTQAAAFKSYADSQAANFTTYANEMGKWRASINTRLATWMGGGMVLIAAIQFYFKYG